MQQAYLALAAYIYIAPDTMSTCMHVLYIVPTIIKKRCDHTAHIFLWLFVFSFTYSDSNLCILKELSMNFLLNPEMDNSLPIPQQNH